MDAINSCLVGIINSFTNLVKSPEYVTAPPPVKDAMREWARAINENPDIGNYNTSGNGTYYNKKSNGGRKSYKKRHTRRNH
jgi:hypothetical protein